MSLTLPAFAPRSLPAKLALAAVLALAVAGLPRAAAAPLATLAPAPSLLALQVTRGNGSYPDLAAALAKLPTQAAAATFRSVLSELQATARATGAGDKQTGELLGAASDLLRAGGPGRALASACPALGSTPLPHPEQLLLTVSAAGYAAVPAVLLLARIAPSDAVATQTAVQALTRCFGGGQPLTQDGTSLQPLSIGGNALALAQVGDVVALATSVDLLRGAVRLAHGSSEPNLAGQMPAAIPALNGNGIGVVVDTQAVASLLAAVPQLGADPTASAARRRVEAALRTVPFVAAHLSMSPQGLTLTDWARVDPSGGDAALAALLRCQGCHARPSVLTPASAVAVEASPLRMEAWTTYVSGLVEDVTAAGGTKVDPLALLKQSIGLDLQGDLFPWLGDVVTSVRLPAPAGTAQALVGGLAGVTIVPVSSIDAARTGLAHLGPALEKLFRLIPGAGKALTGLSPDTLIATRTEHYRGVDVTRIQIGPATDIGVALVGNRLVLAIPSAAMHAVVDTYRGGPSYYGSALAAALSGAPTDAQAVSAANASFAVHDAAAVLRALAQPVAFGIQTAVLAARHDAPSLQASAAPAPPTMAAMLTMAELPADALDTVAGHLGVVRSWTVWKEGVLERHLLLPIH